MPGCDYFISVPDLFAARDEYEAGWSARSIAHRRWREWGYGSPWAAERGLRRALRSIGVEVRDRAAANELRVTLHGDTRREFRDPAHPEHHRYLAYHARRRLVRLSKEEQ